MGLVRLSKIVFFAVIANITLIFSGCNAKRRTASIDEVPRTLIVTLGTGVTKEDRAREDLIYEIGGCLDSWVGGEKESSDRVKFASSEFKPDTVCSVRIKNFALAQNDAFRWANETGPGVLYLAKRVVIGQAINGQLTASATFQQLYSIAALGNQTAFSASLIVTFPAAERENPITAKLQCSPVFSANGIYTPENDLAGVFSFDGVLGKDSEEFACKTVVVWVNGEAKYSGFLAAGEAKSFKLSIKEPKVKISDVPIALAQNVDPTPGDIRVITKEGGPCKDDQVFDVGAGKCRAR